MPQTLDDVQKKFVNEACRPLIEDLIKFHSRLNSFVLDYDNQQTPITVDTEVLNDGTGDNPRTDAPNLTGQRLSQLRTFSANMRDQISAATLDILIELAVRDVNTILRED